jgi:hypothetical protein
MVVLECVSYSDRCVNRIATSSGPRSGRHRLVHPCCAELVPIVGMVVTISPSFSLYRMVVLPAASSPTCSEHPMESAKAGPQSSSAISPSQHAHHKNAHLLLGEEPLKQLRESDSHLADYNQWEGTRLSENTPVADA